MKYGFIGCGNMGGAVLRAVQKVTKDIMISDRSGKGRALAQEPNIFTTDLGQLFSGEISLSNTTVALQSGNENCLIYVEDYDAEKVDDSALAAVVAELEAIIAQGPLVVEEAPAEEAAETPAE